MWQADRTAMHIYSVQSGQDLYLKVEILFSILPLCDLFVERRLSNQKHEMILKMMQALWSSASASASALGRKQHVMMTTQIRVQANEKQGVCHSITSTHSRAVGKTFDMMFDITPT